MKTHKQKNYILRTKSGEAKLWRRRIIAIVLIQAFVVISCVGLVGERIYPLPVSTDTLSPSLQIQELAFQQTFFTFFKTDRKRSVLSNTMTAADNTIAMSAAGNNSVEQQVRNGFEAGRLDAVIFIDIDLMRLTNEYISKTNVNVLLEALEQELQKVISKLGEDNAVSFRRGGDEFILAVNAKGDILQAVEIAKEVKNNVENTWFAVGSLGEKKIDPIAEEIIEEKGGKVSMVENHQILIIKCEENQSGREKLNDHLAEVNQETGGGSLQLYNSWLDRRAVQNRVRFTLSVGVAQGNNYEIAVRDAAYRKDIAKEEFKRLGHGPVEKDAVFVDVHKSGYNIVDSKEAEQAVINFRRMEAEAQEKEAAGNNEGVRPLGLRSVIYYSSQDAARRAILDMQRQNPELFNHAVAFAIQVLGYNDPAGIIASYVEEYYGTAGAVKDNRIDTWDFKVVNESFGYIAGDEVIALLRMASMKSAKLFEFFDVIFVRGPPAGPIALLFVPNTAQATQLTSASVNSMFGDFMGAVEKEFNRNSFVKAQHLRVVWDRFRFPQENVGLVLERVYRTRRVSEFNLKLEPGVNAVVSYDTSIEEQWRQLEKKLAEEAVESLLGLQKAWEKNRRREQPSSSGLALSPKTDRMQKHKQVHELVEQAI